MNSNTFRVPACVLASTALLLAAAPAYATGEDGDGGGEGRAGAVVLRAGLDVGLLGRSVQVPVRTSLNEVQAPASAEKTLLTVELDGVGKGGPVSILNARVARAKATADATGSKGSAELAHAKVHVPGLPLLPLVEIEKAASEAVCAAGERPVAEAGVLGGVTVLGRKVTLTAGGPTRVSVPGVGEVTLDLSERRTGSDTAVATALELKVSVNPLKLNVAEVEGSITLVEATCEAPGAPAAVPGGEPAGQPAAEPAADVRPQSAGEPGKPVENLAETGGGSTTPYLAGGALALLAAGGGALATARRRR